MSRTEQQILDALAIGEQSASDLFQAMIEQKTAPFLGDATFYFHLRRLGKGSHPMLRTSHDPDSPFAEARVAITEDDRRVAAGAADQVELDGIDYWLGGVHLQGRRSAWRWDEEAGRIVAG